MLNTMVEQPIYLGAPENYSWNSFDNQPSIIASRFCDTAMFTDEDDDDETGLSKLLNLYNSTSTADLDIVHCHMSIVQQETVVIEKNVGGQYGNAVITLSTNQSSNIITGLSAAFSIGDTCTFRTMGGSGGE